VQPGKFRPGLRDRDVDAIERQLTDDDFGSPTQRARAENAMRRLADQPWSRNCAPPASPGRCSRWRRPSSPPMAYRS